MDEEVEVNEVDLDIKRIESERCWCDLLYLKKIFGAPKMTMLEMI